MRGFVRIIGGKWRGRKLKVLDHLDLRPTPDRVKETLFNWLSPYINGAYCLDVFAGSGSLGFEALSRGAAYVDMVDEAKEVVALLQTELATFDVKEANVYRAVVPQGLRKTRRYSIVFLDPPYDSGLLLPTCRYLEEHDFLEDLSILYLEAKEPISDNVLPENWGIVKSKKAGQVFYHLVKREELCKNN